MRLCISNPVEILVDCEVQAVRAEDASGQFGIRDGHADFLTALEVSVVSWRLADGTPGYCAVRRGILTVSDGNRVLVATREGHAGTDLQDLQEQVLSRYREQGDIERGERQTAARLRMRAIRHMMSQLRASAAQGHRGV